LPEGITKLTEHDGRFANSLLTFPWIMLLRKIKILIFNLAIEPCPCQSEASEWALVKGQAVCCLPTGTGKTLVQTGRRGKESVIYGENQLSGLA